MATSKALRLLLANLVLCALSTIGRGQLPPVTFHVTIDPQARALPASGRLIVMLKRTDARLPAEAQPIDGPFWDDPQPLYAIDVRDLAPGAEAVIDDKATAFPREPSSLLSGEYLAQARLDVNRESSSWREQSGNLFSTSVTFVRNPAAPTRVELVLTEVTRATLPEPDPRIQVITLESKLLSDFAGKPVRVRAAVMQPVDFDATRHYPAVYEVPGFGGDHLTAYSHLRRVTSDRADPTTRELARSAYWIVLDPESANGHTLFADSENNGPRGRALIEELIPAIEKRCNIPDRPAARVLRGHSSGGWSVLWLAVNYPQTFGAAWSSSPDPVDFRAFQNIDIYSDVNMYQTLDSEQRTSYRKGGRNLMSVRQENAGEEVIGPDNTSAQQWDSWQAVFGPRNARGNPAALFDPRSGLIDRGIADRFASYDLSRLLKADPARVGGAFRNRIRLFVGDQDNFFLNLGVELFKSELDRLVPETHDQFGTIQIIPGVDHGTIFGSPQLRAIPSEMLSWFRAHDLIPSPPPDFRPSSEEPR